jgi:hypothetical protein
MASIFAIIQLLLKLFGLWDQFRNYLDAAYTAEAEKKRQEIEKGVEEMLKAETDEEIWNAQDRITRNLP